MLCSTIYGMRQRPELLNKKSPQSAAAFTTSSEPTTNGMLPKGWRFIGGGDGIYLYKGGTSGAANTGNEPYSEFYASQIA